MQNIHKARIEVVNDSKTINDNKYVLYISTKAHRTQWNHSLEYAVGKAKEYDSGVIVLVALPPHIAHLSKRQLKFLIEGLQDYEAGLKERDIKLVVQIGDYNKIFDDASSDAIEIITDKVYLNEDKSILDQIQQLDIKVTTVESNVVIPVRSASEKREYAARTIRKQLMQEYSDYLDKPVSSKVPKSSLAYNIKGEDMDDLKAIMSKISIESDDETVNFLIGGEKEAKSKLDNFLQNDLEDYNNKRQSPTEPHVSYLSPYLRFGHIAPNYILSRLSNYSDSEGKRSFIEEVLVRRELTHNFITYEDKYNSLKSLPDWAAKTLEKHKSDDRPETYTQNEMEEAKTKDEIWNKCMMIMKSQGYLHNHMRMYWGKQIAKWTNTPQYALKTLLYLNNKYFLDGNDPNSYANALWIFGLHDRAWQENEIIGKTRPMTKSGIKKKIDAEAFVNR